MIDTACVVWVSRAPMDSTRIKGFDSDVMLADTERAIDAMRRNKAGEALPPERLPKELYIDEPGRKIRKLPDLALAGGFWTVSGAVADVLRSMDLGQSSLYPTRVFRYDRKTPLEGEYFCLNFGEHKSAFLPKQSPRVPKPYGNQELWWLPPLPGDDDVAVDSAALYGPDLWIDPRLWQAFFLSDRLASALKTAKLARNFGLFRCRVVGTG